MGFILTLIMGFFLQFIQNSLGTALFGALGLNAG